MSKPECVGFLFLIVGIVAGYPNVKMLIMVGFFSLGTLTLCLENTRQKTMKKED
jgi:hypothetical protein